MFYTWSKSLCFSGSPENAFPAQWPQWPGGTEPPKSPKPGRVTLYLPSFGEPPFVVKAPNADSTPYSLTTVFTTRYRPSPPPGGLASPARSEACDRYLWPRSRITRETISNQNRFVRDLAEFRRSPSQNEGSAGGGSRTGEASRTHNGLLAAVFGF